MELHGVGSDVDDRVAPRAAFDPAGRLFVAWGISGVGPIFVPTARLYDPSGAPLSAPFKISDDPAGAIALAVGLGEVAVAVPLVPVVVAPVVFVVVVVALVARKSPTP